MDKKGENIYKIPQNVSNILFAYLKSLDKYSLSRIKEENTANARSSDPNIRAGAEDILRHIEAVEKGREHL